MLPRIVLITVLSLLATSGWAKDKDNSFCRGFIIKALAAESLEGVSKVDLWLGWDAVVARTGGGENLNKSEYQAGRDTFDKDFAAGNTAAIADIRDGDCDMGRNSAWNLSW
jgi:hypothetical protein